MLTIYVASDTLIEWDKAAKASDGTYLNAATVSYQLTDLAGNNISGASGSMSYVTASDGRYQGVLDSTVSLTDGQEYWILITLTSAGGIGSARKVRCVARYAGEEP